MINTLEIWHKIMLNRDASLLDEVLDDDVVMISPVVHTPQQGKKITTLYLHAAMHVLLTDQFRYTRETSDDEGVILEFETEVDGISVNGVDMVKWNDEGKITEFKVMVRPLQAVNMVHRKMGEMLEAMKSANNAAAS